MPRAERLRRALTLGCPRSGVSRHSGLAATRVVGSVNSGLGEPARDLDQLDVGVLGGTGKHPEGLFAGDVEPLHEDAFRLPDEVAAFQCWPRCRAWLAP